MYVCGDATAAGHLSQMCHQLLFGCNILSRLASFGKLSPRLRNYDYKASEIQSAAKQTKVPGEITAALSVARARRNDSDFLRV
jgi:hypothetical protein